MATIKVVGSVAGLWRFPVKSMRGERLDQTELTARGLLGDRAYALIDADTGKVVSAKSVRLFPDLFGYQATFVEPPRLGRELPPVRITLPDGTSVKSDSGDVDRVLSACFKRNVTLARTSPEDFTIDQYYPDVADLGLASSVPVGSFFDLFPVSVLTTSTLERLNELRPQSRFDERRFRMNVIVRTKEPGFLENDWVGHELGIGPTVRLNVARPDARCVMTTLAQDDLPKDTDILRILTRHNRIRVGDAGQLPCAGVYAVLATPGTVRTGDRVELN